MGGDNHPWIVDLYDGDNPGGADHDFYRALADRENARSLLDLGCGTGLLTRSLVRDGRTVVGLDPSQAMIDRARLGEHAEEVTWVVGDSTAVPHRAFDGVFMTGNVAQHIGDPDWARTLGDVREVMLPGGLLAFDTRNPAACAWCDWQQPEPTTRATVHGRLEEWSEAVVDDGGNVTVEFFNRFLDAGELIVETQTFAFRDEPRLVGDLATAGFRVDHLWGDWRRTRFDGSQPFIVVEARAI